MTGIYHNYLIRKNKQLQRRNLAMKNKIKDEILTLLADQRPNQSVMMRTDVVDLINYYFDKKYKL